MLIDLSPKIIHSASTKFVDTGLLPLQLHRLTHSDNRGNIHVFVNISAMVMEHHFMHSRYRVANKYSFASKPSNAALFRKNRSSAIMNVQMLQRN